MTAICHPNSPSLKGNLSIYIYYTLYTTLFIYCYYACSTFSKYSKANTSELLEQQYYYLRKCGLKVSFII